jgi:antitoxin HigA-1
MRMKKPPHPGRIVRQECIEPLGLTVTEAAKRLGVTRQALNNLVNGKGGISAEMAVRLSKAFGSSPEGWLGMQMEYDLAQVEKEAHNIKVKRVTESAGKRGSYLYNRIYADLLGETQYVVPFRLQDPLRRFTDICGLAQLSKRAASERDESDAS